MGISGTDVAKEAADIVLADDNFATIVKAIERGRWIYDNIKKYLTYLLRANITEVVVLGGVVMSWDRSSCRSCRPPFFTSTSRATGCRRWRWASRRPTRTSCSGRRAIRTRACSRSTCAPSYCSAPLIECPIFLWIFFHEMHNIEIARTQVFLMFVIIELMLALNFRSLRYSIAEAPPHKWLLIAIAWELALIAVLIQFESVREAFGIVMPTWSDVGMALAISAFVVAAIELTKAFIRATSGDREPRHARSPAAGAETPHLTGANAMSRILIPVGGTRNDRFAVQHVIKRFMNNMAMEVHLVNVQRPFSAYVAQFSSRSNRMDHHRERAEKALAPAKEMLDKFSIPYAVHMTVGDRAAAITDTARRLRCDGIVMATARKNSLTRLVENSVIDKVIELTPVPVEVIAGDEMSNWERYGIPSAIAAALAAALAIED